MMPLPLELGELLESLTATIVMSMTVSEHTISAGPVNLSKGSLKEGSSKNPKEEPRGTIGHPISIK